MRPNATRMEAALAFVAEHPGAPMARVVAHLLEGLDRDKPTVYRQAASVVERIVRDRLVRQDGAQELHPWDEKRKAYAEALERAASLAPDVERAAATTKLAIAAWRDAGDENRARILERLQAVKLPDAR